MTVTVTIQEIATVVNETAVTVTPMPVENVIAITDGVRSFLGLNDTPDTYASSGGKVVAVKSDLTGLEFITGGSGAVTSVNGQTGVVVLSASDVSAAPTTRTLTINSVAFDLSANRSWTITAGGSPFIAANDADIPLITRGFSPTQSGHLFEAQTSVSGIVSFINPLGGAYLKGHSAIGTGAVIDHDDTFSRTWLVGLYVADTEITSLTDDPDNPGTFSTFGSIQSFNVDSAIQRNLLAISAEYILKGAGDYLTNEGIFGSVTFEGSSTFQNINGLDFNATASSGSGTNVQGILVTANAKITANVTYLTGINVSAQSILGGHADYMWGEYVYMTTFGGGTAGDVYGIEIVNDTTPTGTVYALYIDPVSGGGVGNYAIYTGSGLVSLNDDLEFRDTAKGPVVIDRGTGLRRRIICTAGVVSSEAA